MALAHELEHFLDVAVNGGEDLGFAGFGGGALLGFEAVTSFQDAVAELLGVMIPINFMSLACPAAWPADFFFVGHASMTRETFERIGRFDESFVYDLFDDDDYGRRLRALGLHTHFLPRALAWHDHPVTLDERITAIERLGEASRRYEERCAPPHSWTGLAQAPLHELEARREELRASRPAAGPVTGFEAWWMAELDCAFLRGYRHADADIAVSSRQAGAGG